MRFCSKFLFTFFLVIPVFFSTNLFCDSYLGDVVTDESLEKFGTESRIALYKLLSNLKEYQAAGGQSFVFSKVFNHAAQEMEKFGDEYASKYINRVNKAVKGLGKSPKKTRKAASSEVWTDQADSEPKEFLVKSDIDLQISDRSTKGSTKLVDDIDRLSKELARLLGSEATAGATRIQKVFRGAQGRTRASELMKQKMAAEELKIAQQKRQRKIDKSLEVQADKLQSELVRLNKIRRLLEDQGFSASSLNDAGREGFVDDEALEINAAALRKVKIEQEDIKALKGQLREELRFASSGEGDGKIEATDGILKKFKAMKKRATAMADDLAEKSELFQAKIIEADKKSYDGMRQRVKETDPAIKIQKLVRGMRGRNLAVEERNLKVKALEDEARSLKAAEGREKSNELKAAWEAGVEEVELEMRSQRLADKAKKLEAAMEAAMKAKALESKAIVTATKKDEPSAQSKLGFFGMMKAQMVKIGNKTKRFLGFRKK